MKFIVVIVLVITFLDKIQCTLVSSCQTVTAPLPEVQINNCEREPCQVYIGESISLKMTFSSPTYLENLAPVAEAFAFGINLIYPLDQTDACDGIVNTPCPIAKGEYVEYTNAMFIEPIFPPIPFTIEYSLIDITTNTTIECFRADLNLNDKT